MTMLQGAPWLLAHTSMLVVNQPRKISLYGSDYVLWKDRSGKISALPNACPHMGAMLSEGWCQEKDHQMSTVVCPFHALEFDSDGCTVLPGTNKKMLPQLQPLKLIIQNNFIWSYGGYEPKMPLPSVLNDIADRYAFIGHTADTSVETDLLSMLLNMHDYNHQNGTHRPLFRIEAVQFEQFMDEGYRSHAFYNMPTAATSLSEKLTNPILLTLPKVLVAHLENHFPSLVIFHGQNALGKVAQIHIFVPESETHTRTYVLMYGISKHPIFRSLGKQFLHLAKVVVEQDSAILSKIYPNTPQKIKLNNEVGMDWVRRNFERFPEAIETNLSRSFESQRT
ncbi:Rieske 2Fe-2S domain-containing protein [Stenomitos frigidus]|uniref:(2Fe-2S)-binding protein n=1 Tax=Stenomitos frigidus ULC18 TaxID=2107698 RepID=A0A2T1ENP8_9CYAN|nr:Rieske 2Fe-2S domain-containing protein [Stenomitos frigidus]PSB34369.1 (2Fe-2S)-binding protein [Stenomitos frigidus ULC18]